MVQYQKFNANIASDKYGKIWTWYLSPKDANPYTNGNIRYYKQPIVIMIQMVF